MPEAELKLGSRVKHKVNHMVGVVTGRAEYLHHPPGFQVEGADATGRPITEWSSASELEVIG